MNHKSSESLEAGRRSGSLAQLCRLCSPRLCVRARRSRCRHRRRRATTQRRRRQLLSCASPAARRRRLWLTGGDVVGLGAGVEPQQPARVLLRPPLQPHRRPRRRLVRLRVCVCVWGGNESSEGLTATPRPPANRSDAYLHQRHCISPYLSSRPRRRLVRLRARVCVGVTSHQRD